MKRAVAYAGVVAAFLTLVLGLARRINSFEPGLLAQYSDDSDPASSAPRRSILRVDGPSLSEGLAHTWTDPPPAAFGVTWTGQLTVLATDTYTLAINADAGTSLFIDGRAVFDNVRHPEDQFASAQAPLARGGHAIFIAYAHRDGPPRFELLWGRGGGPLSAIPAWLLRPRRASELRVRGSALLEAAPAALGWLWAAILLAAGVLLVASIAAAAKRLLERAGVWRAFRWILACSLALSLTGLWWGLPSAWVPIELTPTFVLDGLAHNFSEGWYDAYPPLQYYILSAAISPLIVLQTFSGVDTYGVAGHTIMVVVFRLITVIAGAGVVVCACLAGVRMFGRRAGLLAAAVFALAAPFVFYSKTANVDVPYLFWFAVSVVLYLRLVETLELKWFVLFAAAAACAVCTKDQAYGLYVLVPLVVVERIWREKKRARAPRAFFRTLVDARILAAAATAAVLFAAFHNFAFNFDGFKAHIAFIAGPGSETYRVFEPTAGGRWRLLELSVVLIRQSMGWPLFVAGTAGLVLALARHGTRVPAVCLLVPVVSYYLFFIDVILYNYDRFMLPVCFVLAVFAGYAFDAVLSWQRARPITAGAVALAFVYTGLYAGTVDVLMLRDSRYEAGRWMAEHVRQDLLGTTELPELIPAVDGYRTVGVATIEELRRERPRFFVLNADYARAAEAGTPWAALVDGIEDGALGYRRVSRFRSPAPWPWLPGAHPDLVGPRHDTAVFSVLRDINPTIDIFERKE
jgi:hypothetical protein